MWWGRVRAEREASSGANRVALLRLLRWKSADAVAFAVGVFATGAILVNALLFQAGSDPASTRAAARPQPPPLADRSAANPRPRQVEPPATSTATRAPVAPVKNAAAAPPAARPTPIANSAAERAAPSKRVVAVQRTLAEYGYGQIKPSGILDSETQAAIQKFERERKLPVTGQASERVVRELTTMTGRPME